MGGGRKDSEEALTLEVLASLVTPFAIRSTSSASCLPISFFDDFLVAEPTMTGSPGSCKVTIAKYVSKMTGNKLTNFSRFYD